MNQPSGPETPGDPPPRQRTVLWRYLGAALAAFALLVGAAIPAAAAELMRVTFVRHGESFGNTSGLIDTSTPGPVLTPTGQQQAVAVVGELGDNNYDAIYSSTMVRTQLTAAPMSQYLRLPVQVLPGLQEIEAGIYEGTPESGALGGYLQAPLAWAFQGNRDPRIPGSIDGHEFDARVDGALQTMYDNGDRNAVVYSHGGTIMFWTMMNAQNLTTQQKIDLLRQDPLRNTDYVVMEGNPEDGWTLVDWDGQRFTPEPTFESEVQLQARTLQRQLAAAAQLVTDAAGTGDPAALKAAIEQARSDRRYAVVKFQRALKAKITDRQADQTPEALVAQSSSEAPTVRSAADMLKPLDTEVADRVTTSAAPKRDAVKVTTSSASKEDVSNGATDLKDGNMAVPGKAGTSSTRANNPVPQAITDVSEPVSASVEATGDAGAGEVAGTASEAGKTSNAGADGSAGGDDANAGSNS